MKLEGLKEELREAMEQTREITLRLLQSVPDSMFNVRVHDFYSPVGWHFGHIGMTEAYWTLEEALRQPCRDAARRFLFANIPENPKDNRVHLPSREEIVAYLTQTRCDVLDALGRADLANPNPLLTEGYAWEFARRHECQHQETIAELLQLIAREQGKGEREEGKGKREDSGEWGAAAETEIVLVPGGTFRMGSDDRYGYDNEKKAHAVTIAPFLLDRTPVTVFQWSRFLQDGGYSRRELWTEEGWAWRVRENVDRPDFWLPGNGENGYASYCTQGTRLLHPDEPVCSVSWYEADAYARWAGKRLPTEAEWEFAACNDPSTGQTRRFPWGDALPVAAHACHGLNTMHPETIGKHPLGAGALGLLDMAGNVWEWTQTPFLPYPGFEAFPYDGYSLEHMDGKHFVCRGGSWATAGPILQGSFRNWYVPSYRQGFLGLRCAR